jgi:hypothetical protein
LPYFQQFLLSQTDEFLDSLELRHIRKVEENAGKGRRRIKMKAKLESRASMTGSPNTPDRTPVDNKENGNGEFPSPGTPSKLSIVTLFFDWFEKHQKLKTA